jgi:hypothetical protein
MLDVKYSLSTSMRSERNTSARLVKAYLLVVVVYRMFAMCLWICLSKLAIPWTILLLPEYLDRLVLNHGESENLQL